MCVGRQ